MSRVAWTWRYDSSAECTADPSPTFPTQADAETWIGETWQELLDRGVDAVALCEDERVVYAGMSLHPADPR